MTETAPANLTVPSHVAIIMDGNGRWAKQRGRPRSFGHSKGVDTVRKTVEAAGNMGIRHLTLFSFSTENWNRPADEVGALFELMKRYVEADLNTLDKRGVRVQVAGRRDDLSVDIIDIIEKAERQTAGNSDFYLTIAFNYGGRDEIVRACRTIARDVASGSLSPDQIDENLFSSRVDTAGIPDVDLLIRTSGEYRISNFLLWQAAYAELLFLDVLWPDFSTAHLEGAVREYSARERRYGGVNAGAA